MVPPEKLKPTTHLSQVEHSTTGWLYRYYTAIGSLYRHVVCDVLVSWRLEPVVGVASSNFCKIFIYVHKNVFVPQTSDLLEKLALNFLYNFHRERSLLKLKIINKSSFGGTGQ